MFFHRRLSVENYKITRKGLIALFILTVLAIISLLKGSIVLAVFSFVLFSSLLAITLYEVFVNK